MAYHGKVAVLLGTVVAVVAALVGFVRELLMGGHPPHTAAAPMRQLAGMPLQGMPEMFIAIAGVLLVAGGLAAGSSRANTSSQPLNGIAPVTCRARVLVALVATAALTIDISKTSTLGFVTPGLRVEYGLNAGTASLLAVAGLSGTAAGALLFGILVDRIGRRSSYLLATVGFTVTSMCGSMPNFAGNIVMCLFMGVAVGGLAPLLITLLGDVLGGGARGPLTAALSMIATAIGYLIASSSALWLEPIYGWRILWLIGAPTGVLLVLLTPLVPRAVLTPQPATRQNSVPEGALSSASRTLTSTVQYCYATLIGLVVFGLTTWLPTLVRSNGIPVAEANALLAGSALAMVPCAILLAFGYRRLGPAVVASGMALLTAVMLLALTTSGAAARGTWLLAVALLASLFSVNTMAAVLLPIAADLADPLRSGSLTGRVSFFNRFGGLLGPLVLAALVSSTSDVLTWIAVFAVACALMSIMIARRHRMLVRATAGTSVTSSSRHNHRARRAAQRPGANSFDRWRGDARAPQP